MTLKWKILAGTQQISDKLEISQPVSRQLHGQISVLRANTQSEQSWGWTINMQSPTGVTELHLYTSYYLPGASARKYLPRQESLNCLVLALFI